MPWYYAGPEARPVGPISLEELNARRVSGAITPETYVIEHTGEPGAPGEWRRCRDVFPASSTLPPLPPVPAAITSPPAATSHPLFPSATHAPAAPHISQLVAAPHAHYPVRKTNSWCAWGFGLGIAGFILSFACGIGLLLAVPALVACIFGFAQVQRHPEQSGRGLALAGGVLSILALIASLVVLIWLGQLAIKNHEWTSTEQSSSNSE